MLQNHENSEICKIPKSGQGVSHWMSGFGRTNCMYFKYIPIRVQINPGFKGLEIKCFKIKTRYPSLCLLDAIYGVWSHYINYISQYYVPKN